MHFRHSVITNETVIITRDWTWEDELPDPDYPDLPDSEPLIITNVAFSKSIVSPRLLSYLLARVKEFDSG